jgi:hypothetical protein
LARLTPARNYALYLELSVTRPALDRWVTLATEAGFSVSPIGRCSDPLALIEAQQRSQVQLAP